VPWIVGIDEAGYGPNLGPFVMTAAACHVPQDLAGADFWRLLRRAVRKRDADDDRLTVADSKQVYSPSRGLLGLERTVLAMVHTSTDQTPVTLADIVDLFCPDLVDELRAEFWYTGTTPVPTVADAGDSAAAGSRLAMLSNQHGVRWRPMHCAIVRPTAFNALLDRWGSKGAVLALSLVRLLRGLPRDGEEVLVFCDKHGGRNNYCATLQPAFDDDLVIAHEESAERSTYTVTDAGRRLTIVFEPRADDGHFCVALASMVCKYLRELLMGEFNHFWREKAPGLQPTAGYPGDAKRFWDAIQPAVEALGLPANAIWRRK
jgi:hypothetical protein